MDRTACVDLPALPLQLLVRRQPRWSAEPVVVVDRDKPQGIILWVNEAARASRILPGMRYATGLSLCRDLNAGEVPGTEIEEARREVLELLWQFSPKIEPAQKSENIDPNDMLSSECGVFWLDASGLLPLYPSLEEWARRIHATLAEASLFSVVAVGFSSFGSYAAAKTLQRGIAFETPAREKAHGRTVSLARLGLDPNLRDALHKLGIDTVGAFLDLPAAGVRRRFGDEAHRLLQWARQEGWGALDPLPLSEPLERTALLDHPEKSLPRLLLVLEPLLEDLLIALERRDEALAIIFLHLVLDDGSSRREQLRPAEPTLESRQLMELLELRLESVSLSSGVVEIEMQAAGVPVSHEQLSLFAETTARDARAANRALARVRAELGEKQVVHARLRDGHLPEASFEWAPLDQVHSPRPRNVPSRPLVRRILAAPMALPARTSHEPDGWLIGRFADGPVEESIGPHIVSGGWWMREVHRSYHYVRTGSGRWLWVFHDRGHRRWFLHGEVE